MNGFFDTNFLMGWLVARDRPNDEAILNGLKAGMLKSNMAMAGTLLSKRDIDRLTELEKDKAAVETELNNVRGRLRTMLTDKDLTTAIMKVDKEKKTTYMEDLISLASLDGSERPAVGVDEMFTSETK